MHRHATDGRKELEANEKWKMAVEMVCGCVGDTP